MNDLTWVVPSDRWPVTATEPVDREDLLAVLDEFGRYWPGAVESLADTEIPAQGGVA